MFLFASLLTVFLIVFDGIALAFALQIILALLTAQISKPFGGLWLICVLAHAASTNVAALMAAVALILVWLLVLTTTTIGE